MTTESARSRLRETRNLAGRRAVERRGTRRARAIRGEAGGARGGRPESEDRGTFFGAGLGQVTAERAGFGKGTPQPLPAELTEDWMNKLRNRSAEIFNLPPSVSAGMRDYWVRAVQLDFTLDEYAGLLQKRQERGSVSGMTFAQLAQLFSREEQYVLGLSDAFPLGFESLAPALLVSKSISH